MIKQSQDYLFRFPYNQLTTGGLCRVRMYEIKKGSYTILVSELASAASGSIVAAADTIANNLVTRYGLDPKKTRWIEHLQPQEDQPAEFGELVFTWKGGVAAPDPKWRQMQADEVEALTGDEIEELNRPFGQE